MKYPVITRGHTFILTEFKNQYDIYSISITLILSPGLILKATGVLKLVTHSQDSVSHQTACITYCNLWPA